MERFRHCAVGEQDERERAPAGGPPAASVRKFPGEGDVQHQEGPLTPCPTLTLECWSV